MTVKSAKVTELIQLDKNIWTAADSLKLAGMEFGMRMTVIRLGSGSLLLHSPIPIHQGLKEEIDSLGEVKYLIAPNRFHHLHITQCSRSFPDAELWAAPGLAEKRKDVKFDGVIVDETSFGSGAEIEQFLFEGIPLINEVVFYHSESKTLILTDLIFNFPKDVSPGFKLFLRLFGLYGGPKVSRLEYYLFLKDRDKARESARKVLSLDFGRVILAHRDIIPSGGKELVRKAFEVFS